MSEPKKPHTIWASQPGQSREDIIAGALAALDQQHVGLRRRSETDLIHLGFEPDRIDEMLQESDEQAAEVRLAALASLTAAIGR